jgi:hypothetical protein
LMLLNDCGRLSWVTNLRCASRGSCSRPKIRATCHGRSRSDCLHGCGSDLLSRLRSR